MLLEPGMRLGSYDLEARLGEGGMGQVWKAYDPKLRRTVAIKVLKSGLPATASRPEATSLEPEASSSEAEASSRLLTEARAASALNHPHICTIYEVSEAEPSTSRDAPPTTHSASRPVPFIVMELVEGKPLSELIPDNGLPPETVVRYGSQIADALGYAHEHGVVHRDLKSANVVVTRDGRAKVLDFGVADRLPDADADAVTRTREGRAADDRDWALAGTLAYMAPEQLRGEPGHTRTDVWSLGVLLYEMAVGRRPYVGRTGYELSSAILQLPLPQLPAAVPGELQGVIRRCLERQAARRYQSGRSVHAALEAIRRGVVTGFTPPSLVLSRRQWLVAGGGVAVTVAITAAAWRSWEALVPAPGSSSPIRLAVLPFQNLSGDFDQDYLSDGLTDEMISQLGRLHPQRLSVIARTSVMRYKNRSVSLDQIGRELGVDYVLEGSVLRERDRIRVNPSLIRVQDQTQTWSESYELQLAGVMALQSDVARGISDALALTLLPETTTRLADPDEVDPEAYEAYLRGRSHLYRLTPEDLDAALEYFDTALERAPNDPAVRASIAMLWASRGQMDVATPEEAATRAREAVTAALARDDSLPEAHLALAEVYTWQEWNWAAAGPEFERAIRLNPSYPDARAAYSHYLSIVGRMDESLQQIERAVALDPFNPMFQSFYAGVLMTARRYADAIAAARNVLQVVPDHPVAISVLTACLYLTGRYEQELKTWEAFLAAMGDREVVAALQDGYAEGGYAKAMHRAAETLATRSRDEFVSPMHIARFYQRAGDTGQAMDWLERAFEQHDQDLPYLNGLPYWDSARTDPRFEHLLERLHLPQVQVE